MSKERPEYPCLEDTDERVQCGNDADIIRQDDETIIVRLANGGYVKLSSETPIIAVVEPNGDF